MLEKLLAMFAESYAELFGEPDEPLTVGSRLVDLDIESLDFIEISMRIEDEFDLEVDAASFEGVETVGDALTVFEQLVAARSAGADVRA